MDSLTVQMKMGRKQSSPLRERKGKKKKSNFARVRICSLLCLHVTKTSESFKGD